MAERVTVVVPDLGDFKSVDVIDVLVKAGDVVAVDTPLATLETEKAAMDVPSSAAGRVVAVRIAKGDKVAAGSPVVDVEVDAVAATAAAAPAPVAAAAPAIAAVPAPVATPAAAAAPSVGAPSMARIEAPPAGRAPIEEAGFSRAHASPSVRRFARELGVDLARVKGSGLKGRVSHEDVKAFVKQALTQAPAAGEGGGALPKVPVVDFAAFGPVESRPLGRIKRISGARLHASWVNLPHVTQFDEADITELEATRERLKADAVAKGFKLTPLAFVVRAVALVLKRFPQFSTSLDASGQNLVFKQYCHIGFAADTPNGLVVPVIRDADRKDIYEIARALAELSDKARAGKLTAGEMQGGSFTISSLGGIGGTAFTPIINAPEVAILGVSRSQTKPVWIDGAFQPRLVLPLSLSYDHRVIDGAEGARFTSVLAATLSNPNPLIEAVP